MTQHRRVSAPVPGLMVSEAYAGSRDTGRMEASLMPIESRDRATTLFGPNIDFGLGDGDFRGKVSTSSVYESGLSHADWAAPDNAMPREGSSPSNPAQQSNRHSQYRRFDL